MNENTLIKQATRQLSADSPFTANNASLWGVTATGETISLGYAPDIYDLLETAETTVPLVGLLIHTTGWAAPLNNEGEPDGKPSQHPERRRVSLCAGVSLGQMFSVMRFQDTPEDAVEDEGNATGSLADALAETLTRLS